MTLAFDFHPEAEAELVADVDWYDERESGVGGRFADAVRAAIESAVEDPAAWAATVSTRSIPGTSSRRPRTPSRTR
jgi:hypothetical protein